MPILGVLASSGGVAAPVAGYNLWLDAADATTFTFSSGSVVSQWTDKSANAYAFTQATVANQPIRDTTQNAKSTLNFDGNDRLTSTAASSTWKYLHDGTGATIFMVARQTAGSYLLGTNNVETIAVGFLAFYNSGTNFFIDTFPGVSGQEIYTETTTLVDETYNVFSGLLNQSNATTANKQKLFVGDGAAFTSTGAFSPSASNPQQTLTFGRTGAGYGFTGQIAEIITYTSLLSESDRQKNVDYLQGKWGL